MKVAVVGCSINGAYVAWRLAKAGHKVTVFERKKKVGGKACSGLVSTRIWSFIPQNNRLVQNTISSARINFPRKSIEVVFKPKMLALDREMLDNYITTLAKKTGATINFGHNFVGLENNFKNKTIMITTENNNKLGKTSFDFIVGCDGTLSHVRKLASKSIPNYRTGIYCYNNEDGNQNYVDTWPTASGFSWRIPRGKYAEYGVIEKPEVARKAFEDFIKKMGIKPETKPKSLFSATISQGLCLSNNSKVALCGDAAGLTKPHSGGGILWGFIAADLLIKSNLDVAKYNMALKRKFSLKMSGLSKLTKFVNFAGNNMPFLLPARIKFDNDFAFF